MRENGVLNGGATGGGVTLKNPNKQVKVSATLNGEAFDFAFGDELTKEGSYCIILTDEAGTKPNTALKLCTL